MIKEAIDKILSLTPVAIHEINGEKYATSNLNLIKKRDQEAPDVVKFATLTGLIDFVKFEGEPDQAMPVFFHVRGFNRVDLKGQLQADNANVRFTFGSSNLDFNRFEFGNFYDLESFIVAVQSQFIGDETTDKLLGVIGNLANEHIQTSKDDGVTQTVQVKTGITTKSNVSIENPMKLRPFRTFREIEQPASNFIFRIKDVGGQPKCALFESDGGAWKLAAIENIKAWLRSNCSIDFPVIG